MNPSDLTGPSQWSNIFRAREAEGDAASARNALLLRYHEVVFRYLRSELRDKFVAEVARSLQVDVGDPEDAARVEQELIELGLLFSYCKNALPRCRPSP